ncbi:MAG: hypothetical protein JO297_14660 [Nitrososphaeraceae archaeon]|nr:hypothetical protein [Nitrososphaeraceae archaeon]
MQKNIATGRSTYVEMRAVSRMVAHNMGLRINSIKSLSYNRHPLLSTIFSTMSSGYEFTLTPNGVLKRDDLEKLISIDSDIANLLVAIESNLRSNDKAEIGGELCLLKELLNKRKALIEILKA